MYNLFAFTQLASIHTEYPMNDFDRRKSEIVNERNEKKKKIKSIPITASRMQMRKDDALRKKTDNRIEKNGFTSCTRPYNKIFFFSFFHFSHSNQIRFKLCETYFIFSRFVHRNAYQMFHFFCFWDTSKTPHNGQTQWDQAV